MTRRKRISVVLAAMLFAVASISAAYPQTLTVIHTFTGTPDGANPYQSTLVDVGGTLYGTTGAGGAYGYGTIFKMNAAGEETVLYSFTGGADGSNPSSGLIRDKAGNLYGTTFNGGDLNCILLNAIGCGVVYEFNAKGLAVLWAFTGGADGAWPQGAVLDTAGNVYGPAFFGGTSPTCPLAPNECGVIFEVTPQKTESVLYNFQGGTDGGEPQGFVTRDAAGNIYGATIIGGNNADCPTQPGCGVIFKIDPSGVETALYTFTGGADGANGNGILLLDPKGDLYGTAVGGGDLNCSEYVYTVGCGVVFKLTPSGKESVIHTFTGPPSDGANPTYGLAADAQGNAYSTTLYGGADNFGTVFEITSKGAERVLYSFTDGSDGGYPQSGMTFDTKGNLYSNTAQGGDLSCGSGAGCGTVFKLTP